MKPKVLAATLVAAAALAVPASAGGRFHSTVTIHLPPDTSAAYFYGAVRSHKAACARGRDIKLVRDPDGSSGYSTYATGIRSNADGTWTYHAEPYVINGYYKAVAAPKKIAAGVCAKAASKPFFVD